MDLSRATLICAALFLANPAFAGLLAVSPAGAWQSADGTARVRVSMCGDGTKLCAVLTAVEGKARTPGNLKLLNTYVVSEAQMAEANVWLGVVHFNGESVEGRITLVTARQIEVSGCNMGVCKTLMFERI